MLTFWSYPNINQSCVLSIILSFWWFKKYLWTLWLKNKVEIELNCTSKGFSYSFLDLAKKQSFQGLFSDVFYKRSQPQYKSIKILYIILILFS